MDTNIKVLCIRKNETSKARDWKFYLVDEIIPDAIMDIYTIHGKESLDPSRLYPKFFKIMGKFKIIGKQTETYTYKSGYTKESNMTATWSSLLVSKMQEAVYQGKYFCTYTDYDDFFKDFPLFHQDEFKQYFENFFTVNKIGGRKNE